MTRPKHSERRANQNQMPHPTEFPLSITISFKQEGVVRFFVSYFDIILGKDTKLKFQVSRDSFCTTGPRQLYKGSCFIWNSHDPDAGIFFVTPEFSVAFVTTYSRCFEDLTFEDDDASFGQRMEFFQELCESKPTLKHYKKLKYRMERLMEDELLVPDEDLDLID